MALAEHACGKRPATAIFRVDFSKRANVESSQPHNLTPHARSDDALANFDVREAHKHGSARVERAVAVALSNSTIGKQLPSTDASMPMLAPEISRLDYDRKMWWGLTPWPGAPTIPYLHRHTGALYATHRSSTGDRTFRHAGVGLGERY